MLKSNKKVLLRVALALPMLVFAITAQAADLRFGGQNNQDVYRVPSTDTPRNLYTAGPQLIIDANSSKDITAVGGSVTVNGTTADDLIVIGGEVVIRNLVGGSAKVLGGQVRVEGKINEDLVVVGGRVYISSTSSIGGDLVILGGSVITDAPVAGSVRMLGGALDINSTISGDVSAKLGQGLFLGPNANLQKNLTYTSPTLVQRDANAKVAGTINYTRLENRRAAFHALLTVTFFIKLAAMILAAFAFFYVFRNRFTSVTNRVATNFWRNLGIGALALIVFPIAALILVFTLIGFYVGLILLAFYFMALLLSALVSAAAVGSWLLSRVNDKVFRVRYRSIALGIIVVAVLQLIPLIGPLIMFVLVLSGLGAVVSFLWDSRKLTIS